MDVVEGAIAQGRRAGERGFPQEMDLAPADVRQACVTAAQGADISGDQAQAVGALELIGAVKRQLHAEADPEDRCAGARVLCEQPVDSQRTHAPCAGRKRSHTGKDERVGPVEHVTVGADDNSGADVLERFLDRPAVAHPVIDQPDQRLYVGMR